MNWDAIGAIGELVGALAVILTLGYLAIQVRQNTLSMRVAAKQEVTRQFGDYSDMLLNNPDLLELFDRLLVNSELPKSDLEAAQLRTLILKATWYFSSMHYQFMTQSLSAEEWHQSKYLIALYCSWDSYRTWWRENSFAYPQSFVTFIESHWQK